MELYQLRTFVVVADTGHLTQASERLHLSQPAVSAHIKALEQQLEIRLFERTATGMGERMPMASAAPGYARVARMAAMHARILISTPPPVGAARNAA